MAPPVLIYDGRKVQLPSFGDGGGRVDALAADFDLNIAIVLEVNRENFRKFLR